MVDHTDSGIPVAARPAPGGWRARLRAATWPLAAVALVLALLAALGRMELYEALLAFVPVAVAAALLPRPGAGAPAAAEAEAGAPPPLDAALTSFAASMADPCLILERNGTVLYCNPAALGELPAIAIGEPVAFSIRHPALIGAIDDARAGGGAVSAELQQTVPNATWYSVTVAPFSAPGPDGPRDLLAVTLRNLTTQRRAEAMRVDFVANASHELRTPLTSVIGFIDTLLGPAARDGEAREKFLRLMRGQAERMSRLIDDLLSLSRIEMRQHLRPTGTVRLDVLLREVAEGLQTQARDAGLEVWLDLPAEAAAVTGDREELYEVFENLLDNALKYGEGGGHVDIALAPAGRHGFAFAASVTDHGPGIAAEHVPRLTERFYRADVAGGQRRKGTGLGLAISKHIVSRHRGRMTIRSAPGEGMRVEVLLPD